MPRALRRGSKTPAEPFRVELAPAAVRSFRALDPQDQSRVQAGLLAFAAGLSKPGRRGGKSVKTLHSAGEDFTRIRIGNYRVMCDVLPDDRVVLVAGIIDRRDLETWLRKR